MNITARRIQKAIKEAYEDDSFDFFYDSDCQYNEIALCYVRFVMPSGSRFYANETHIISIDLNTGFPMTAPKVQFITPILHVNVSGLEICLDILDDKWCPLYGILAIVNSIKLLLMTPNRDSILNPHANSIWNKCKKDVDFSQQAAKYYNDNMYPACQVLLSAIEFDKK